MDVHFNVRACSKQAPRAAEAARISDADPCSRCRHGTRCWHRASRISLAEFGSSEDGLAYAERAFQNGDDQTALNLFSKLATHNNPNAEYWLGHMHEIGLGIPRDAQTAIDLYKRAADQNVVAAEARLGDIYLSGDQVPPDFGQAKYYLDFAQGTTGIPGRRCCWTNVPGRPWNSKEVLKAGLCMVRGGIT